MRFAINCLQKRFVSNVRRQSPKGHFYDIVSPEPFKTSKRIFPSTVSRPNYAVNYGLVNGSTTDALRCFPKTEKDVKRIAEASRLASLILNRTANIIEAGITGEDIDDYVYKLCLEYNCYPSPLNYNAFPKCVTVSVNNVAVHGIPDSRKMNNGDIVTVDVTVFVNGVHGDTAKTFVIGNEDEDAMHLIGTAQRCLEEAVAVCKEGMPFSTIGETIERIAKESGLKVIPSICGHGIGERFHEPPQILHFDCKNFSDCEEMQQIMCENMVFTIEPVIGEGDDEVEILSDGWTVATCDKSRTAQFEHTICVKKDTSIILTGL